MFVSGDPRYEAAVKNLSLALLPLLLRYYKTHTCLCNLPCVESSVDSKKERKI